MAPIIRKMINITLKPPPQRLIEHSDHRLDRSIQYMSIYSNIHRMLSFKIESELIINLYIQYKKVF